MAKYYFFNTFYLNLLKILICQANSVIDIVFSVKKIFGKRTFALRRNKKVALCLTVYKAFSVT